MKATLLQKLINCEAVHINAYDSHIKVWQAFMSGVHITITYSTGHVFTYGLHSFDASNSWHP